ncbi:MAG: hypothetical protein GX993_00705 [Bacteroidales bacterium]|nr:hypothetical protein [Bacteroidales bacterium]
MDVSLFSRTIKELILDNDRVGVPGLGHFVAELMPASFSDRRTMINPPYRRMSFVKDDVSSVERELFLSKLEEISDVPEDEIDGKYNIFVRKFISNLEEEKSADLPSLGRMHATSRNEYFFVADEDLDIYPDGIGLEPVSIKAPDPDFVPVAPPEPEAESAPESEAEQEQEQEQLESELEQTYTNETEVDEQPEIEPSEEPKQEPEIEKEPVEVTEVDPEEEQDSEPKSESKKEWYTSYDYDKDHDSESGSSKKTVWLRIIVAIIVLLIALALLLYFFRDSEWLSPLLDKLLYTKEELRILGR